MGEALVAPLRKAGREQEDADGRLRALALAAAIERRYVLQERSFTNHTNGVNILAISPDGKRLASASAQQGREHAARVWEVATGKEVRKLQGHSDLITGVGFLPSG